MDRASNIAEVIKLLRARFAERCSTSLALRQQHGKDVTFHPVQPPDAVVFAESTEDVSEVVGICHDFGVPVVPFGTGTSCEGHIAALKGGICIDLSQMNKVLRVSVEDLDCTVQPGVTRKQLNSYIRDTGLFFPIDPGADASIGGMASTRASGTNAVRYGTMRENVLSLQVVLSDGEVITTSSRARKSAAGYDLTRLFVGAEGTLGVLTEVTLKLHPLPQKISAAVCAFESLENAVSCVISLIQLGIPIARVELLDELQIAACNRYSKLHLAEKPTLFFEFHGTDLSVDEQVRSVKELAEDWEGSDFSWANTPEERSRLWQARHDVWWAALALRQGCEGIPTDSCVPISHLAEAVIAAKRDVQELGMIAPICGHVGDGNFHLCIVLDPSDPEELRKADELNARLTRRSIAFDGTCSGEHGIGYGKIGYLEEEFGAGLRVMAEIKRALDPRNIMNPGKVINLDKHKPLC